ncbi:hypothetical protein ACFXPX_36585 [Kitasatospora sp. NPDC059146]|uniref:hypothetical protein n=1 Tax=unclassified Kitasatospora TaxID=2633591 RepID=UPI0036B060CF
MFTLTIKTATVPGGTKPSEDRVRHGVDWMVVADGVTTTAAGVRPRGADYADVLAAQTALIITDRALTLPQILAEAITGTAEQLGLGPETEPGRTGQATIAVGRAVDGWWEAAVIGDCTVAGVRTDDRAPLVLTDTRLADITRTLPDRRLQDGRLLAGEGRIGDDADRQLTAGILERLEHWANQPDGYGIAAADPKAGLEARTARWPLADIRSLLLTTDGGSRATDLYQKLSWDETDRICRRSGPQAVLDLIRRLDGDDPDGHGWPRRKRHDDATIAHAEVQ